MLALPLLAAAMALAPPEPKGHDLVTNENYPHWALDRNKQAGVIYTIYVTPEGSIAKCVVRASRGDKDLADAVCPIVERRRMKPAVGSGGAASYGVYTDVVNFVLSGTRGAAGLPIARGPDAEFTVNKLPESAGASSLARVTVEVGGDGTVSHCAPAKKNPGELAGLACHQLTGANVGPMTLGDDRKVSYVQAMTVRFKTKG